MSRSAETEADVCTLILVRHGESEANLEGRFTRHDDEPLTARGVDQARTTGRTLAALYRPAALYCSPFLRARETARLIGEALGLAPSVVRELYEQSFGELRGRPYADYFTTIEDVEGADRWSTAAPGGESLRQVAARVGPAVDRLAVRHRGEEVVVVSHGGVMAALRAHAVGHFRELPQSTHNAGGYVLSGRPGRYRGPLPFREERVEGLG